MMPWSSVRTLMQHGTISFNVLNHLTQAYRKHALDSAGYVRAHCQDPRSIQNLLARRDTKMETATPEKTSKVASHRFRVGFLIHDVSRLRKNIVDKILRPLGVTRSQWWVLVNLSRHGSGMVQTELAQVLDIGKVALGGLIDRLEKSGYVARVPSPTDRRAKYIEMTDLGIELLARIQEEIAPINSQMLGSFSTEEMRQADDLLSRMKRTLLEMDAELRE